MRTAWLEFVTGIFIVLGIISLLFLTIKVSGLSKSSYDKTYQVSAIFNNIGDLKIRAPVSISGVKIGEVGKITLNPNTFEAIVILNINKKYNNIPTDSVVNIFTAGLLGSNYINIAPGFAQTYLKNGSVLPHTNPALILQNLIGQLLYSFKNNNSK